MASTKIADVIVPSVFNPYVVERTSVLSALWESGIVANMPELNVFGMKGGTTLAMPYWKDLTGAEEILSDVVPLGVDKITSGQDIAVLNARGKAWGVNDLAEALSGDDPMSEIGNLVAAFWARRMQTQLLSELSGVFKSASMSGNISDISGNSGAAAVISGDTVIDALYKMGDAVDKITAFAMHSAVVAVLAKQGLIDFQNDAEGNPTVPIYMGKRVIMDDGMPVNAGVYTSYIFGAGAIGYAEGGAPTPTETDRDSLAGEDILINRRHYVLHPRGVAWIGTSTGVSPTNTEFDTGTNWSRRYENKNIRIVQFKHKIA